MGQTIRQKQIDEQAQIRSEKCIQNVQEIYRIAFRDGAEWADKTKEDFIPEGMMPITVERNADGTVSKDLIQYLCALPASKSVIAKDDSESTLHYLNHDQHVLNDYAVLNDVRTISTLLIIENVY